MTKNRLDTRIDVAYSTVNQLWITWQFLDFLFVGLRKNSHNFGNNFGIIWLVYLCRDKAIIDLSKLLDANNKSSLRKIINIAKSEKYFVSIEVETKISQVEQKYRNSNLITARDKFVAHSDIILSELKVDIFDLYQVIRDAKAVFTVLYKALTGRKARFQKKPLSDLKMIIKQERNLQILTSH